MQLDYLGYDIQEEMVFAWQVSLCDMILLLAESFPSRPEFQCMRAKLTNSRNKCVVVNILDTPRHHRCPRTHLTAHITFVRCLNVVDNRCSAANRLQRIEQLLTICKQPLLQLLIYSIKLHVKINIQHLLSLNMLNDIFGSVDAEPLPFPSPIRNRDSSS